MNTLRFFNLHLLSTYDIRKSMKVLKVEVKVIFSVFWPYFNYNIASKNESQKKKLRKISILCIKKQWSAAVREARRVLRAPPTPPSSAECRT